MNANQRRLKLIKEGKCPQCWQPRDDEGQTCSSCREKRRLQAARRREASGRKKTSRGRKPISISTEDFLRRKIEKGEGFVLTAKRCKELTRNMRILPTLIALADEGVRAAQNIVEMGISPKKPTLKVTEGGSRSLNREELLKTL